MYLQLRAGGKTSQLIMEQAGNQRLAIGSHSYQIARIAHQVRRYADRLWGAQLPPEVIDQRLIFEAAEGGRVSTWTDSGSYSPMHGATVELGRWDETGSVAIALHELAHEMHTRHGGYRDSDGVMREVLAILAERETGLERTFEREPYYTAHQLVCQLGELPAFARQSFAKRWEELIALTSDLECSDLVNYYLDRSERLGLHAWLKRYTEENDLRDALMQHLASVSLRYSLPYRRQLLSAVVACPRDLPLGELAQMIDAVNTLDRRYPDDDLSKIITFCFSSVARPTRRRFGLSFGG